jgi:hypothetical protein
MVIIDGSPGKARTSWICAGVNPRIVLGSAMNGRLGAETGEHPGSGQKTRTNWVGVAVTTIAAGAVGTNDGVAVHDEGKMYALASAPFMIDGTKGGGQENGALNTGPVRTVPGGSGSGCDQAWSAMLPVIATRAITMTKRFAQIMRPICPIHPSLDEQPPQMYVK